MRNRITEHLEAFQLLINQGVVLDMGCHFCGKRLRENGISTSDARVLYTDENPVGIACCTSCFGIACDNDQHQPRMVQM